MPKGSMPSADYDDSLTVTGDFSLHQEDCRSSPRSGRCLMAEVRAIHKINAPWTVEPTTNSRGVTQARLQLGNRGGVIVQLFTEEVEQLRDLLDGYLKTV